MSKLLRKSVICQVISEVKPRVIKVTPFPPPPPGMKVVLS